MKLADCFRILSTTFGGEVYMHLYPDGDIKVPTDGLLYIMGPAFVLSLEICIAIFSVITTAIDTS